MTKLRDLAPEHRRWLLINAVIITAVINLVLNAAIAWFSVRGAHQVRLWGLPLVDKPSTVLDTVGTFFFLPLFTCLMVTTAVWAGATSSVSEPTAFSARPASHSRITKATGRTAPPS